MEFDFSKGIILGKGSFGIDKKCINILITFIMQLNELSKRKINQILKKLKLVYKYRIKIILLTNKIFIIENI